MQFKKKKINEKITFPEEIIIADPTYKADSPYIIQLNNVQKGQYNIYLDFYSDPQWGQRIASITAVHENYEPKFVDIDIEEGNIAVDSGTAGIYAKDFFKHHPRNIEWLEKIWNTVDTKKYTLENKDFTVNSGFGDGFYNVYTAENIHNQIIAISIVFIE